MYPTSEEGAYINIASDQKIYHMIEYKEKTHLHVRFIYSGYIII